MTHRDVLIVDDDAATRLLLQTLIARAGLSVHATSDGAEAVRALREYDVDAIVMDLFMPRMNGIDLLDELTNHHHELLRKVIVLSAAPEALLGETRRKYAIWCTIRKPADISDLMQNVLDCVVQRQSAPASMQPQI